MMKSVTCILLLMTVSVFSKILVSSGLTHEFEGLPGDRFEDQLMITNTSEETVSVQIEHNDYRFDSKGFNYFEEINAHERSNGSWVQIESNKVIIPPKGSARVPFIINIPKDKDLIGTYWSVFLVQPEIQPIELGSEFEGLGIQSIIRYAVQVITNIKDTGEFDIKIMDRDVVFDGEKTYYQFAVENQGTRIMSPKLWMEVFGEDGKAGGLIHGSKVRVYPGTAVKHKLDISDLDIANYTGLLIFDQKGGDFFGSQIALNLTDLKEQHEKEAIVKEQNRLSETENLVSQIEEKTVPEEEVAAQKKEDFATEEIEEGPLALERDQPFYKRFFRKFVW